ncbi:MAG: PAS domain S-box protein [Myxococcales bacterium]|nr:PAS domain S-box protein [Myxococcales bacterium]
MTATTADRPDPYRELFERSADAILIIDDNRFVECNQATVTMLGYDDREQLLRTHPSELSPPTQPDGRSSYEKADEMMATAFARGSHRFEWAHRRRNGEVFPVEVLLTAVEREGRPILHVVWRDITERKRLEEHVRHTQKLDAIGQLAAGVAHDFNNILVAIMGNAELLQRKLDVPEYAPHLDEIVEAGHRAASLVRQLLTFSRKQESATETLDLIVVLADLRKMLGRLIADPVRLHLETTSRALPVRAARSQVELVVVNLITNARDAMPAGGTISLGLEAVELRTGPLTGSFARLAVTDTGVGMSPETVTRAIEPFFTTKEVGKGTGLGLATAYGVARAAGGDLRIESELGKGTRVEVLFPLLA